MLLQVVGAQQYIVKPMMSEHAETVLSEHILAHSELTEDLVNSKGVSLGAALIQVLVMQASVLLFGAIFSTSVSHLGHLLPPTVVLTEVQCEVRDPGVVTMPSSSSAATGNGPGRTREAPRQLSWPPLRASMLIRAVGGHHS